MALRSFVVFMGQRGRFYQMGGGVSVWTGARDFGRMARTMDTNPPDGAIRVRFVDESGASTDGGSLPPA